MSRNAAIAAFVSALLVTQVIRLPLAHAEETAASKADAPSVPVLLDAPLDVLDAASRLGRSALRDEATRSLATPAPSPIMSNNTKTVVIVAIVAGAVLILVGVLAVGKPFKKP